MAAISPADVNFEESLSTLSFADRAKALKTKPIVNENPTDKLIRELRDENAKLKAMLEGKEIPGMVGMVGGESGGGGVGQEELKALMERNELEMDKIKTTWEEQLREARGEGERLQSEQKAIEDKKKKVPHLWNLNEDPALSGVNMFFIDSKKEFVIGYGRGQVKPDFPIYGLRF